MLNAGLLSFDAGGRIRCTTALPKHFNGGTPMNGDLLCIVSAAPTRFVGGLGYDVSGALCVVNSAAEFYSGGIPIAPGNLVAVDGAGVSVPSHWVAGLPITAGERLLLTPAIPVSTNAFSSGFDEGFF